MIEVRLSSPGLDVEFQAGNGITALLGSAGAGQTAILDAIAGFLRPTAGRIILNDELLFDAASRVNVPPRRRQCAYVARQWALFPHLSLRDNLLFPLAPVRRLERHRRVNEMIERFALKEVAALRPSQVAAPDRLRAAIARALIGEPKLLLVDEPAGGLDIAIRDAWHAALRRVRDESELTVLLAAYDLDTCFELAGNMLLLEAGRILQSGSPRKLLEQPSSAPAAQLLGIGNLFPAEILALDPGRNTSRLRLEGFDLTGPYFPGRLRGDQVWVCVAPVDLRVAPQDGARPQPNQIATRLESATELPYSVRLVFTGAIVAEVPRHEFASQKDNKEWLVEFPPQALKLMNRAATERRLGVNEPRRPPGP
jgi:ABC-type Fe3+/spermidine/putrescine transport system ATPase subunit